MPGSLFNSLKPLAGQALQAALNRALALDPDTRDALLPLEGQRIALTLEAPALALQIRVHERRLLVGPVDASQEPDLAVRSSLAGLLGQLPFLANARRSGRRPAGSRSPAMPSWRASCNNWPGVSIRTGSCRSWRCSARSWACRSPAPCAAPCSRPAAAPPTAQSAAEFVTEESRDVVPRAELEAFHDDVDELRDAVERLAARINRLSAAGGTP